MFYLIENDNVVSQSPVFDRLIQEAYDRYGCSQGTFQIADDKYNLVLVAPKERDRTWWYHYGISYYELYDENREDFE